jgi:hypothetical protein
LCSIADRVEWPTMSRWITPDSYTAPQRLDHPARRTRFGANNTRTEEALRSRIDILEEKVAAIEASVVDLKQQAGVLAANQVEHADMLDSLLPRRAADVGDLLKRLGENSHPGNG